MKQSQPPFPLPGLGPNKYDTGPVQGGQVSMTMLDLTANVRHTGTIHFMNKPQRLQLKTTKRYLYAQSDTLLS